VASDDVYLSSPSYLDQLASAQTSAASDIGGATASTSSTAEKIKTTHGQTCLNFSLPVERAMRDRSNAIAAIQDACNQLAKQLSGAKDNYGKTEQSSTDAIDMIKDHID